MRLINNVTDLFGDDLKTEIAPGAKVRIVASTFSIYAFEALKHELEQVDELRFIFTSPSFVTAEVAGKIRKERRQFFIPAGRAESSIAGSEFEIRLRNKLTQKAIARECADWVRRKARFRSNMTGDPMQPMAVIDERVAYLPIQGFTTADLGYERGRAVSNVVTKIDDTSSAKELLAVFDRIWDDPVQLDYVTRAVHNHIATFYAENYPERI